MPAPERSEDEYELECSRCEKHLLVDTEELRASVLSKLSYSIRGRSARGRVLTGQVPGVPYLQRLDRLEPSSALVNPCEFETAELPFRATFWRKYTDPRRRKLGFVTHRSPLFSRSLGTSPNRSLAIDSLHSVYLCGVHRWVSASICRPLALNPWRQPEDMRLFSLVNDLHCWQNQNNIPHDRRIGNITAKMLPEYWNDLEHPGGLLKLKAAECHQALLFMIGAIESQIDSLPHGVALLRAGKSIAQWIQVTHSPRWVLAEDEIQALVDLSVRHRIYSEQAMITVLPKHHAFGNASIR